MKITAITINEQMSFQRVTILVFFSQEAWVSMMVAKITPIDRETWIMDCGMESESWMEVSNVSGVNNSSNVTENRFRNSLCRQEIASRPDMGMA
ncbi:hypothetical protein ACFSSA_11395 [Luteolibacter algae]|uniref:Uncharacterized protein n=1 Tax=Luteolibacter algae TaxID=454151 RepID=A0ABW5DA48_9BACT